MKKNLFISTLTFWVVTLLVYCLYSYPKSRPLLDFVAHHLDWSMVLSIYFILISIASILTLTLYEKVSFSTNFILSLIYINVISTIIILAYGLYRLSFILMN